MTLGEFKAFIEGMDLQGPPTEEQWVRIQDKLMKLEQTPLNFSPTYLPPYNPNTCTTNAKL